MGRKLRDASRGNLVVEKVIQHYMWERLGRGITITILKSDPGGFGTEEPVARICSRQDHSIGALAAIQLQNAD